MRQLVILTLAFLVLGACTPDPVSDKLPNDIRWVRESGEYQALCEQVYNIALLQVKALARQMPQEWAVVMDLDETVLDNSQYQVELTESGSKFSQDSWSEFVNREISKLVPGAKMFLDSLHTLPNIRLVYISNRMSVNTPATRANLEKLGVWQDGDILLLRADKEDRKPIRRQEVFSGTGRMTDVGPLPVLAYFGDALGDFPDDDSTPWGFQKFVLPNPMYGKW